MFKRLIVAAALLLATLTAQAALTSPHQGIASGNHPDVEVVNF